MWVCGELRDTHPVDVGRLYLLLADVFADLGDEERAVELYELAVEQLEARPPTRYLVQAYKSLAALLKNAGKKDEALDLLERALGVQETAGRPIS